MNRQLQHTPTQPPTPPPHTPPAPEREPSDTMMMRRPAPRSRKTLAQAFAELVELFND